MEISDFEIVESIKEFYSFYFIESHLNELDNEIELIVDSSHKCLKPLRKINEKKIHGQLNKLFVVSVYRIDLKSSSIKQKEIKNMNGVSCILIKLLLKTKKNKFESKNYVRIDCDNFIPTLKFEKQKKIFGKDAYPPEQMYLPTLEKIQIFNDTLLIKEKKTYDDITFIEFLKFCVVQLKKIKIIELNLYYMIYINILNSPNTELIKDIFDLFNLNKLKKPFHSNILAPYKEKMDILYNEQNKVIEKIKKIPNINFNSYLIKFYTIYIYLYSIIENYESCEKIMLELKDNNPYDNSILPKLYLSEFCNFYQSISISIDLQNSLMGKFINISSNYNELVNAFSSISTFTKENFVTILLIITKNYDKIYEICKNYNCPLNIIEFINQSPSDDLLQIQNHLEFITKKKLENNFTSIKFILNIWDFYLSNGNNKPFLEYLKYNLIMGSICYDEIIQSLSYLTNYTHKNFIEMLDLIIKNYTKFRIICMNQRKQIMIKNFIEQSVNDNLEKIKEYLSFIVSEKLKDQYETVCFDINIWNFYIFNHYSFEFLSFLEMKLYESALTTKDISYCLTFSSNFINKSFQFMLEKILFNFDKIQSIIIKEKTSIDIKKYIVPQINDDLYKIYDLIKKIIEKESFNKYCSIKFDVDSWSLFSNTQRLESLKLIKKIINECKIMQPNLNGEKIQLEIKIHNVGFSDIRNGTLIGEPLLNFIGEDEIFYVDNQINQFMKRNKSFADKLAI